MPTTPKQSDDAPKTNPDTEDALGFRGFARRLAQSLYAIEAPNGYVIGLEGPWGSGKSTAINFAKHYLQQLNQSETAVCAVEVVDFRPWLISGREDLISAFFKVLTETIEPKRSRRKALHRQAFTALQSTSDALFNAVAVAGAAAAGPAGGGAVKAATTVVSKSFAFLVRQWLETPSLQSAQIALAARLAASRRRFLVIIDDIDRLQPGEITTVMQLVKSIGGLPNVVYLLAYDPRIVWSSAPAGEDPATPSYAEKIIQHQIQLPTPNRSKLLTLLDVELTAVLAGIHANSRWSEIVRKGVFAWITSVRDVNRLANALRFAAPAIGADMDPHDLVAMEGLKLFEPDLFGWIRQNRDYLLREGRYQFDIAVSGGGELAPASFYQVAGEDGRRMELMSLLFPARAKAFGAKAPRATSSSETYAQMRTRRGVATKEGYDTYFSLEPPEDIVTKRAVDQLIADLSDEQAIRALIAEELRLGNLQNDYRISELLNEIAYRFVADRDLQPSVELLSAVVGSAEAILAVRRLSDDFVKGPGVAYFMLVETLLERWGEAAASDAVRKVYSSNTPPHIISDLYVHQAKGAGLLPSESREVARIDQATLSWLGDQTLAAILTQRADGILRSASTYWQILDAWRHLGDADAANQWLRDVAEADAVDFAKISLGYLAYSTTATGRFYIVSRTGDPDPAITLDEARALARRHLDDPRLDADERARLQALAT